MKKILTLSGLNLIKLTIFITSSNTLLKSEGIPFEANLNLLQD